MPNADMASTQRNSKDKAMQPNPCRLVGLPKVDDARGSLSYAEAGKQVPFEIRRIFFLHGVPEGVTRAGHALKTCEQLIIATSGEFSVVVDDGASKSAFRLRTGGEGLYLPSRTWLELEGFLPGSVCLVLASERYSEDAYIRSYDEFTAAAAERA